MEKRIIKFRVYIPKIKTWLEEITIDNRGLIGVSYDHLNESLHDSYVIDQWDGESVHRVWMEDGEENSEVALPLLAGEEWFWIEDKHCEVMQFVGFKGYIGEYTRSHKHRNEVELYEGDIVEAMSEGSKGTFVIKFREGHHPGWILYPAYQANKMWSIHPSDLGREKGDFYDDLKRIGNIHDNPELLTSIQNQTSSIES